MNTIRSKSIAALSIMLLLSNLSVQSMESVSGAPAVEISAPAVAVVAPIIEPIAQVQPVVESKGWFSSARGLFNSAAKGASSAMTSVASKWSARPSFAEAKEAVSNQASSLYETAKEHPYITAAIAAPIVAVAGYGVYRAGKAVKASRNVNALIADIENEIFNDLLTVQLTIQDNKLNGTAKVAGSCQLAQNLLPLIDKLPASKQAVKAALQTFGAAAVAWDNASDFSVDRLKELNDAHDALQKLGLNIAYKPSLKEKVSALVPTKKTVKKAAILTSMFAVPAVAYAYSNGAFDGAINAGSNVVSNVVNTVSNVDYAGYAAKAQASVAPATGFVANHKYAFGVPAVYGASYGMYRFANNRIAKAKAAKALKPAPELANDLKQA